MLALALVSCLHSRSHSRLRSRYWYYMILHTTIAKRRSRAFKQKKVYQNRTIIKEVMSKNVHPAPVPDDLTPVLDRPAPIRHPSGTCPAPVRHWCQTRCRMGAGRKTSHLRGIYTNLFFQKIPVRYIWQDGLKVTFGIDILLTFETCC